jgi:hypothetical protein
LQTNFNNLEYLAHYLNIPTHHLTFEPFARLIEIMESCTTIIGMLLHSHVEELRLTWRILTLYLILDVTIYCRHGAQESHVCTTFYINHV